MPNEKMRVTVGEVNGQSIWDFDGCPSPDGMIGDNGIYVGQYHCRNLLSFINEKKNKKDAEYSEKKEWEKFFKIILEKCLIQGTNENREVYFHPGGITKPGIYSDWSSSLYLLPENVRERSLQITITNPESKKQKEFRIPVGSISGYWGFITFPDGLLSSIESNYNERVNVDIIMLTK
jgi:hypothetical protein